MVCFISLLNVCFHQITRQAKYSGRLIPILSSFIWFLALSALMKEDGSLTIIFMKLEHRIIVLWVLCWWMRNISSLWTAVLSTHSLSASWSHCHHRERWPHCNGKPNDHASLWDHEEGTENSWISIDCQARSYPTWWVSMVHLWLQEQDCVIASAYKTL